MKRLVFLTALILVVAGVVWQLKEKKAELPAAKGKSSSAESSKKPSIWDTALAKAEKLGVDSSKSALDAAREQALQLQTKLADVKVPSELQKMNLEAAQLTIVRLSRAMDIQKWQQQAEDLVARAKKSAGDAQASADDIRAKLAATNDEYQKLQANIQSARSSYEESSRKLEDLKAKIAAAIDQTKS